MTAKRTTTMQIVASGNEIECDIDFYITPGIPESFDSPEELMDVEIFDIRLEGNSIMHPVLMMSDDELGDVARTLCEAYMEEF